MEKKSWLYTRQVEKIKGTKDSMVIVDWTAEREYRANSSTVSLRVSYRHVVNMLKSK